MSEKLADIFEKILITFNKHKVDYMLAGGYAVIFHGYGRTTSDLNIWVKPSNENKEKIIAAFRKLHYSDELTDQMLNSDFNSPFSVKIGIKPLQIDIFNAITGVKYEDAKKNSISFEFSENLEVHFIHLHDLIVNKMLTGRLKDLADVEELHKINIHSKDKGILSTLKKLFGKK